LGLPYFSYANMISQFLWTMQAGNASVISGDGTTRFLSKIGSRITRRSIEEVIEKHAERLDLNNPGADVNDNLKFMYVFCVPIIS
jgi:hypothetical protein